MKNKHFQIQKSQIESLVLDGDLASEFDGQPDIRFLLHNGNSKVEDFCFFHCVFPPGAAHVRHTHPNAAEFLYIIRGCAAAGTEDEEHEAPAGTAIFSPKDAVHWIRNLSDTEDLEFVGGYSGAAGLDTAGYNSVSKITEKYRQVPKKS